MNILISMCLLGLACRYDGQPGKCPRELTLLDGHTLIPVCPEQLGGLATPRPPAERLGERVVTREGGDVTAQYRRGAEQALELARRYDCRAAVLKAKSPSCGSGRIYDGSFTRQLTDGWGITAQLLQENGLRVYDETQIALQTVYDALNQGQQQKLLRDETVLALFEHYEVNYD